ncbi:MAG: hypothetical protein OHK0024_07940 [Thalassobaculales bacterium]
MILVRHGQSWFNFHFNTTRQDPGIPDPGLTPTGRDQAAAAAEMLRPAGLARLLVSPYRRTLETASIIAEILDLPIAVEPLVHEMAAFSCDIGTPASELGRLWPDLDFSHLEETWWPAREETSHLEARCRRFAARAEEIADRHAVGVITHWGFIRGLTGLTVPNGAIVRLPAGAAPELLHPAT